MILKSFAKINLSLIVNKKLIGGLHDLQSIYCLINLFDTISIKKIKNKKKDKILIKGPYSKYVSQSNNSITKTLDLMRKSKLISNFYSITIDKKIPVFAGLGGGSSNAATVIKFLIKKNLRKKILNLLTKQVSSDLILFFHDQGYLKNLHTVYKIKKKYNLNFLLIYPNIKSSTKKVYSSLKKYSKKKVLSLKHFKSKNKIIDHLINSKNDLQLVVEKKHPIIRELLIDIRKIKGCYFSRMTGSGSTCYGLFTNENSSKVALKKIKKKYPKFSFLTVKTI